MTRRRTALALLACALVISACGDDDATTTTVAATTADSEATTTTPAPTTTATTEAPAPTTTETFSIDDNGVVTIDWSALEGVFFASPTPNASDPLYFVHNNPETDGFFLGLEAYTVYGPEWTGELGTYEIDCSAQGTGICLHFDPDGAGPEIDAGFDFLATGTVEIVQADMDGFEAILTDVEFTDGTTIPGPVTVTGGEAG